MNWAKGSGRQFVWIWLHKGVDEFMSNDDYQTFYWAPLKKVIQGLIDADLVPVLYGEGKYDTRLEILRDVPVGKVIYHFEHVDMARAKDVLGDVACITGNVPNTLPAFRHARRGARTLQISLRQLRKGRRFYARRGRPDRRRQD